MKILRTASLGSNFTGSYRKRECTVIFITISAWSQSSYFSVTVSGNDHKYLNLIQSQKTVFQRFQFKITFP